MISDGVCSINASKPANSVPSDVHITRVLPPSGRPSSTVGKHMKSKNINLATHASWVAFPITGIISAPVIPLGPGPDMYIVRESHFVSSNIHGLSMALKESFQSFGFEASEHVTLKDPKLLLVPITDDSDEAVKNALLVCDMALAFFNKKYFSARARFLNWDRKAGKAIGVMYSKGTWLPILRPSSLVGPAIVKAIDSDFWDWFLGASIRNQLPPLGEALYKCIEWERESQFSSHITHRFAFNWIGLESMMPKGEYQEHELIRRYSLIIGAPRGSDSQIIMKNENLKLFFDKFKNKNSKKWVKAIEEMYRYRCTILHNGSSDLNSIEINPMKVDWFCHVAKALSTRITGLAVNALIDHVNTLEEFWDNYVIQYLYSDKNHWSTNGTFLDNYLIEFDWENRTYPEVV